MMDARLAGAFVLLAVSCAAPTQPTNPDAVELESYNIACDDAHRHAAHALKARGYRITSVAAGPAGGVVEGSKGSGESASIRVSCAAGAVRIQPSGSEWEAQGMRLTFSQLVRFGDKPWPPPTGPQVKLEILRGAEARLDFPQELEPLGMIAMRVQIVNGGTRAMRIDPRRIRARSGPGGGAAPVAEATVRQRLAADPRIAGKLLHPAVLKHGEEAEGFVFLPAATYRSVVLIMVDDRTNEADEFEVSLENSER